MELAPIYVIVVIGLVLTVRDIYRRARLALIRPYDWRRDGI